MPIRSCICRKHGYTKRGLFLSLYMTLWYVETKMLIIDSTSVTKRRDISLSFYYKEKAKEYGIGCRTQNRLVDRLLKLLDIDSCYDIHRMKSNGDKVFFLFFFNAQKYIFGL